MAEQTPGVKNKKLLIVALVLALLVVMIYNVHIQKIRNADKEVMVHILKARHDLKAGSKISDDNVQEVEIPQRLADNIPGLLKIGPDEKLAKFATETTVRPVQINNLLTWADVDEEQAVGQADRISVDAVATPIAFDPQYSPGELIRPGTRVNILGRFDFSGRTPGYYRVISGVRVQTVGGQGVSNENLRGGGSSLDSGVRTYRTITVEVSKEASIVLNNVLTPDVDVRVEVVSARANPGSDAGRIDPEFLKLAQQHKLTD